MKYLLDGQETARLKFRLLTRDDFISWLDLFKDNRTGGFLGMANIPSAEEQCEKWFSICEHRYLNDLGGMNVLVVKKTNLLVGQCGLLIQEVDHTSEMEIGYSILPAYRSMGYATEAARKCRDFAFMNSYSDSIISIIHIDNIQSEKVAIRNGMIKTKQTVYKEMPVNIYRIEKREWMKIQASGED
jgi:[ribosomal protein S5]-alanine N-acetyltransferase